jgi:hypothetical protein
MCKLFDGGDSIEGRNTDDQSNRIQIIYFLSSVNKIINQYPLIYAVKITMLLGVKKLVILTANYMNKEINGYLLMNTSLSVSNIRNTHIMKNKVMNDRLFLIMQDNIFDM